MGCELLMWLCALRLKIVCSHFWLEGWSRFSLWAFSLLMAGWIDGGSLAMGLHFQFGMEGSGMTSIEHSLRVREKDQNTPFVFVTEVLALLP